MKYRVKLCQVTRQYSYLDIEIEAEFISDAKQMAWEMSKDDHNFPPPKPEDHDLEVMVEEVKKITPVDEAKEWRVPFVARSSDVDFGYLVVRARTVEEARDLADGPDSPYTYEDIIWDDKPEVIDTEVELDTMHDRWITPHKENNQ